MPTVFELLTGITTNFSFLTKQNPASANLISYIFLYPSTYRLCRPIYNELKPIFYIIKLNICLASQITRNMSVMMMILTWVHSEDVLICQMLSYVLCTDSLQIAWRHQLYPHCWKLGETLINWSTNWLYAQSSRTGHSTHILDGHR